MVRIAMNTSNPNICGDDCPNLNKYSDFARCELFGERLQKKGLLSYKRSVFCRNYTKISGTEVTTKSVEQLDAEYEAKKKEENTDGSETSNNTENKIS
jgi:hypothetical protein